LDLSRSIAGLVESWNVLFSKPSFLDRHWMLTALVENLRAGVFRRLVASVFLIRI
jgi:hypothetical protein